MLLLSRSACSHLTGIEPMSGQESISLYYIAMSNPLLIFKLVLFFSVLKYIGLHFSNLLVSSCKIHKENKF